MLYQALQFYKLTPELRWTAGEYIWPIDEMVKLPDSLEWRPSSTQHQSPGKGSNAIRLYIEGIEVIGRPGGQVFEEIPHRSRLGNLIFYALMVVWVPFTPLLDIS